MDKRDIIDINKQQKVNFGQYFFNLFNKVISLYFLKIPNMFVYKMFVEYQLSDQTLKVIFEVLKISNNKKM